MPAGPGWAGSTGGRGPQLGSCPLLTAAFQQKPEAACPRSAPLPSQPGPSPGGHWAQGTQVHSKSSWSPGPPVPTCLSSRISWPLCPLQGQWTMTQAAPIMSQGIIQGPDQRLWGPLGKGQARPPPPQRGEPAFPPGNLPGPLPTDGPATPADTYGHDDPHTPHRGPSVRQRSCWLPGGADVQPSCDPRCSRAAHVIPDPPSGGSVGLAGQPAHRSAGGARLVTSAQGHRATEGGTGPAPLRENPGARSTRLRTCPQPLLPQQPPPPGPQFHTRPSAPWALSARPG